MGLVTGLLTLPLAPVRGTMWIAEKLLEAAEQEADPEGRFRVRLEALQVAYELGELTEQGIKVQLVVHPVVVVRRDDEGNLLGLAYTAYCSAALTLSRSDV